MEEELVDDDDLLSHLTQMCVINKELIERIRDLEKDVLFYRICAKAGIVPT